MTLEMNVNNGLADAGELTEDVDRKGVSSIIESKYPLRFSDSLSPDHVPQFIEEVKSRPALWSRPSLWKYALKNNKTNLLRENNWKEISNIFQTSQYTLKKQWKNMRESFSRCQDKRDLKSRSGVSCGGKLPTCRYYNELLFLRDGYVHKSKIIPQTSTEALQVNICTFETSDPRVLPIPSKYVELHTDCNNIQTLPLGDVTPQHGVVQDDTVTPCDMSHPDATYTTIAQDERPDNCINAINSVTTLQEEDSDLLFCKSMVSTLRELPRRRNALVRMKIQQLLFNAQFDENFDDQG